MLKNGVLFPDGFQGEPSQWNMMACCHAVVPTASICIMDLTDGMIPARSP